jgi:hypothetical protein
VWRWGGQAAFFSGQARDGSWRTGARRRRLADGRATGRMQAAVGPIGRKKKRKKRKFQKYALLQFIFTYLFCAMRFRPA